MRKRFKGFEFWDGALFGALILLEIVLLTAWLFDFFGNQYWPVVSRFIAIPAALLGAIIAFTSTRFQISYAQNRDLAAWRAVLPLALSEMINIAQNGILIAANEHPEHPKNANEINKILQLSPETLTTLQNCIRAADNNTEKWLTVLVARYQVYATRASSLSTESIPVKKAIETNFTAAREDALLDWATFHALVEHHYDFARRICESVPKNLDTSRINSAFFLNIYNIEFDSNFQNRIDMRLKRVKDGDIHHFLFSL